MTKPRITNTNTWCPKCKGYLTYSTIYDGEVYCSTCGWQSYSIVDKESKINGKKRRKFFSRK